eukprot:9023573-Pyramimonas_sp.AAC.1
MELHHNGGHTPSCSVSVGGASPPPTAPQRPPVADSHRAPKGLRPPSRRDDEARLTPRRGGTPPRSFRNPE